MKPDNEPLFCHSSLVCKHDSKPFEYNKSAFDTASLEGMMKENQNGVVCDLNNRENDVAPLASEINSKDGIWNTPELECTVIVEDFPNVYGNEAGDSVTPHTIPSRKLELFEKNSDLYTDKNVTQCELPEVIVCCKENTHNGVKDICIDEGVPFKDKILIESENDKGLCTVLPSDENNNGSMRKERVDIELLSPDGSKSSSENDQNEDDDHECGIKGKTENASLIAQAFKSLENRFDDDIGNGDESLSPVQTIEANYCATDKIEDDVSREKFVTSSVPSLQMFSKQRSLKSLLESPDCDDNEGEQHSGQIPCSEAECESPAVVSSAEESNKSSPVSDLSYNSKVERATITFDFNSSKSAASSRHIEPRHEGGISDSFTVGSQFPLGQGESSFSMAGPVSSRITYSGSMVYSGSVSLRSDSSTTSNRSFAFPILQSEWNSSPVRMAKADRRHYRKHRGWRLCCRF